MRIVYASTQDQEERIRGLIKTFYSNIFPQYFSDSEIDHFKRIQVLHTTSRHFEFFGTLKEAYQVITSLQTIISILETSAPEEKYKEVFKRNTSILKDFGLFFPFDFEQFSEATKVKNNMFSIYTKAANELLV